MSTTAPPSMDKRVGADEAGLHPSDPAGRAADERGEAVDGAVDAAAVEEDQRPGEVLRRAA